MDVSIGVLVTVTIAVCVIVDTVQPVSLPESGRTAKAAPSQVSMPHQQAGPVVASPTAAPQHAATPTPGGTPQQIDRSALRVSSDMPPVDPSELRVSSFLLDAPERAEEATDEFGSTRWDTGRPQRGGEWFRIDLPGVGELSQIRLRVGDPDGLRALAGSVGVH